ncbi:MAG: DUF1640 domain-containing protein [Proteobacteria bacterium]|nr:MAG: DUF1640 domain-containing protein [Pseudomonadota bacterium]
MTVVTFDTLKFAKKLESAGMEVKHAEALAEAQKDVLAEALENQLATKSDIARVENKITLVQWMLGVVIAVEVLPLLKTLF